MNPFDLPGPEFLLFYVGFSALAIIALVLTRKAAESSAAPKLDLSDPYLIAFLRGAEPETLRVASVSLIDRGLLVATGTQLRTADNASPDAVRRPIEKELLRKFKRADEASSIFEDSRLKATCKPYEQTLKTAELLPNERLERARWSRLLIACGIVGGVGIVKIMVAFSRGRTNVGFLIILIAVAIFLAVKVSFPRLTESGKAMVADLQNLYSGLKDRALFLKPGGATIEPIMLAAIFGVSALESADFAFTRVLFPRAAAAQSSATCGSSYASACSSCGSSCSSSSCGGGGCGGGCGGCGG
ncbi:MAG TPA: TIGR04222 domain-containing membrane protein [Pyrinomonadaceae bacterium]|nr:TIGR04222 domain-containing membrane protein [Pyrinomonadaceae bacterium]